MRPSYRRVNFLLFQGCCLLSACSSVLAQNLNSTLPEGWVRYPMPRRDSETLYCANQSDREWQVADDNGDLQISLKTGLYHHDPLPPEITVEQLPPLLSGEGDRHVVAVDNGWLVGRDAGEWGGDLVWFSTDGTQTEVLVRENVRGFARWRQGEVLVLAGLSHLGLSYGKVLQIVSDEPMEPPQVIEWLFLEETPTHAVTESEEALLLLTSQGLIRLASSGETVPVTQTDYSWLYPNSMVRLPNGDIYIGMRHFITQLIPIRDGYTEQWFAPADQPDPCRGT